MRPCFANFDRPQINHRIEVTAGVMNEELVVRFRGSSPLAGSTGRLEPAI